MLITSWSHRKVFRLASIHLKWASMPAGGSGVSGSGSYTVSSSHGSGCSDEMCSQGLGSVSQPMQPFPPQNCVCFQRSTIWGPKEPGRPLVFVPHAEICNDLPCTVDMESTHSLQFYRTTLIYNKHCSPDLLQKDSASLYALFIPDHDYCSLMCSFLMNPMSQGRVEGFVSKVLTQHPYYALKDS